MKTTFQESEITSDATGIVTYGGNIEMKNGELCLRRADIVENLGDGFLRRADIEEPLGNGLLRITRIWQRPVGEPFDPEIYGGEK